MKRELQMMRAGFVVSVAVNVVLLFLLLGNRASPRVPTEDSRYVVSTSPILISASELYREARVQQSLGFYISSARVSPNEFGSFEVVWSVPRKTKPIRQ